MKNENIETSTEIPIQPSLLDSSLNERKAVGGILFSIPNARMKSSQENGLILTNGRVFRASNSRDGKPMFTLSSLIKGRICVL